MVVKATLLICTLARHYASIFNLHRITITSLSMIIFLCVSLLWIIFVHSRAYCNTIWGGFHQRLRHPQRVYHKHWLVIIQIWTNEFCTCHHHCAVVTCAIFRCGWIGRLSNAMNWILIGRPNSLWTRSQIKTQLKFVVTLSLNNCWWV